MTNAVCLLQEVPVARLAETWSPMGDRYEEEDRVQFALSPELSLLKDSVDAFVRDHAGTDRRRSDRAQPRGYSAARWLTLAEIGVLGVPFTAEDGGLGGGPRELITVMECLGRGLCIEPVLEEVVVAGGLLARAHDAA